MANRSPSKLRRRLRALVDTDAESAQWSEVRAEVETTCEWLERLARMYGRQRVESLLREEGKDYRLGDAAGWISYWRRWRAQRDRHLIPMIVLGEPWFPDAIARPLVLEPRLASVNA
jgi:hypothetical protein